MPFARMSDLDGVLRCTGRMWLTSKLPEGFKPYKHPRVIEAANWGTDMHSVKETGLIPEARLGDGAFRRRAQKLNRGLYWPEGGGRHEVSFSYDVLTGEVESEQFTDKEEQDKWKTSRAKTCVVGTADWVGDYLGKPHVDDLKTGRMPPDPGSYQNMGYGLCVAVTTKSDDVLLSSTHHPREGVNPNRLWAPSGFFAAYRSDFQESLLEAYSVLTGKTKPRYTTGPVQCAYCPAKEKCPV